MKSAAIFAGVALSIALPLAAMAAGGTAASVAKGKTLYNTNCSICHTPSGAGGIHFGSAVSANLQSPHLEKLYHNSDAMITRAILKARDQNDQPLDMPMPAWQGRLSQAQAQDIIDYLRTLHS